MALGLALWAAPQSAASAPDVYIYELLTGTNAVLDGDGSVTISNGDGLLLSGSLQLGATGWQGRDRTRQPFSAVVSEGAAGGQRGFSVNRDDDHDGMVDEDPLDGRDNDGDGRIDEDYAAISDAMVVFDRGGKRAGAGAAHLEYYHWSYPWLRSTVFLSAARSAGSGDGFFLLELPDHGWQATTLISARHSLAGKTIATTVEGYIVQPGRNDGAGGRVDCGATAAPWVGVLVSVDKSGRRPSVLNGRLEIPLGTEPVSLAICVAESWLQLNTMLNEAARAQAGAEDKITGRRAPMIVAPQCALCRLSQTPDFSLGSTPQGRLALAAHLEPGRGVTVDPDLFRVEGRRLGAPSAIQWLPVDGQARTLSWTCLQAAGLAGGADRWTGPYVGLLDALSHQSRGQLRFLFESGVEFPAGSTLRLSGAYLDGRTFETDLVVAAAPAAGVSPGPIAGASEPQDERRISLSPKLLEGFPNPFRDQIQLRIAVPATMGEAFFWNDEEDPPSDVNLQAAPPWQNSTPNVSVRIYSLNGQELVTLLAASMGPGESTIRWDGTDQYGRQAASGTYFCKLQIDQWSVTKRVVYLR